MTVLELVATRCEELSRSVELDEVTIFLDFTNQETGAEVAQEMPLTALFKRMGELIREGIEDPTKEAKAS